VTRIGNVRRLNWVTLKVSFGNWAYAKRFYSKAAWFKKNKLNINVPEHGQIA